MKLYYSPGACSLSPHIAMLEAGFRPTLIKVDLRSKKTEADEDYFGVNPNGYVPALVLNDGSVLTEGPAILQYLADQVPEKKLAPDNGTLERYRMQSLLNFITSELHKSLGVLFNPAAPTDWKNAVKGLLAKRFTYVDGLLAEHEYAFSDQFTVADAYLFTILRWTRILHIDTAAWPRLDAYLDRMAQRPAVRQALQEEGLIEA